MKKGTRKSHCIHGHERLPEKIDIRGNCRLCKRPKSTAYNLRNPTKISMAVKRYALKTLYGTTPEAIDALRLEQRNCCAICNVEFVETRMGGPCIDHPHGEKRVRGLLCQNCNHLLGHAHEKTDILVQAILYLVNRRN